MNDELRDELCRKLFYSKHEFPENWGEVATIAAECVRAERERIAEQLEIVDSDYLSISVRYLIDELREAK